MTRAQTARLKAAFIEHFSRMGNITQAAEAAGVSRRVVYAWQERDERFSLAFNEANAIATERLEAEAWRRAVDGDITETPIIHQGKVVITLTEHKRSDTLLIFLLKARAPHKYRDRATGQSDEPDRVKVYADLDLDQI